MGPPGVPLNIMPFATGGSFDVGGAGGVDSQLVQFRASPGERVSVQRTGASDGGGGSQQIVFNNNAIAPGESQVVFDSYIRHTFATAVGDSYHD